jgi:hypothetical protein
MLEYVERLGIFFRCTKRRRFHDRLSLAIFDFDTGTARYQFDKLCTCNVTTNTAQELVYKTHSTKSEPAAQHPPQLNIERTAASDAQPSLASHQGFLELWASGNRVLPSM